MVFTTLLKDLLERGRVVTLNLVLASAKRRASEVDGVVGAAMSTAAVAVMEETAAYVERFTVCRVDLIRSVYASGILNSHSRRTAEQLLLIPRVRRSGVAK